jgi:hypothetical protein
MARYTLSSLRASTSQFIKRYARWLILVALLVLTALAAYHITPAPAAISPAVRSTQTSALDPTTQSVLAYLRARSGETAVPTPAALLDSAQQSVMQYVYAHDAPDQPRTLWDQVKQTVLGYLRGMGKRKWI